MKRFFVFGIISVIISWSLTAYAKTIEKDGIYFEIYSDLTAAVVHPPTTEQGRWPRYTIEEVIIPSTIEYNNYTYTVNTLGYKAFEQSSLSSITIPATIRVIENHCFCGCANLKTVWIQSSDTPLGICADEIFYGDEWDNKSDILDHIFHKCNINVVVIERDYKIVRKTGYAAIFLNRYEDLSPEVWKQKVYSPFVLCDRIGRVEITRNLKSRWIASFYNPVDCMWLGEKVNEITQNWPCSKMDKFFILNTIPPKVIVQEGSALSLESAENTNLYVPALSIDLYRYDTYWRQFKKIMSIEDAVADVVEDGSQPFVISGNRITFDADVEGYTLYDINGNIVSYGDGTSPLEVETTGIHILHLNNRAFKILF